MSRGFALLSPEARIALASKAGKAAHASGKAHHFTPDTARLAAQRAKALGRSHAFTTETGAIAGKKGGALMAARPGYMSALGKRGGTPAHKRNLPPPIDTLGAPPFRR